MRIAIVVNHFPVLSETFVIEHVSGLLDRGHDVVIHSFLPGDTDPDHPLIERHGLMKRVRHAPVVPVGFLPRTGFVLRELVRGPNRSRRMLLASLNPWRYRADARSLRLFGAILGVADSEPYDVICAHFGPIGQRVVRLRELGAISGPLATIFHGLDLSYLIQSFGPRIYDELLRDGELFLPVSAHFADVLKSLGAQGSRISVHHVGVDCQELTFVEKDIPEEGPLQLLSIARLVEKKGIEFGIRAVAMLRERSSRPIRYRVIGDGPMREDLLHLVRELGLCETVDLVGKQHPTDVRRALREAHILLAPSVTSSVGDKEGIPVVLMEAMACGTPVVSTVHSGIPELVLHGVSGLLAPERDPEALAVQVETILGDPEGCRSMCKRARQHVETEFNSDRQADLLVGLLEDIRT